MNTIRSSINFFTLSTLDLENNIVMKKLFRFFFKSRPLKPRYSTFWSVDKVLDFLKTLHPPHSLSLKDLTLKTIALIALSSSDRGQTLHLASTRNMRISDSKIEFVIVDRIKTTRKVLKPTVITCVSSEINELNVAEYVKQYIERTADYRNENYPLFISWVNKKPVSRQTLARWLKLVLSRSGIHTLYTVRKNR